MADSRAPAEPYVRSFETAVEDRRESGVVLAETYFYPEGGGQPADRGTVGGVEVTDVQERDGAVVHELAGAAPEPGATVACVVDESFRTYCMRAHTASHALYGAARRRCDDLGYGGFDIDEKKVRVDLATPTDIDDETLVELERLVNRAVWDSRPVTWETLPREEALDREDVAFNTKTEEGIAGNTVRVVEIEGWDVAACGGTHVRNTREIGPVTVLDRSNPGEGLTRVEFAVGPTGIGRRVAEKEAALGAAGVLGTGVEDLVEGVERLRGEREDLRDEVAELRAELADARIADLPTVERDGATWLVGAVEGLDANGLADRALAAAGDRADVAALVDAGGEYVAVASDGDTDAGAVVDDVTDAFGGGGGGSPAVAQGGGLDADADEVVAFLRDQ